MRDVREAGSRALSVVAASTTEFRSRVRAGVRQIDVQTRMRGEGLWVFVLSDPVGGVRGVHSAEGERSQIARLNAIDAQVTRSTSVESSRFDHPQSDVQIG